LEEIFILKQSFYEGTAQQIQKFLGRKKPAHKERALAAKQRSKAVVEIVKKKLNECTIYKVN